MFRILVVSCFFLNPLIANADDEKPQINSVNHLIAASHELKPHRRLIPLDGALGGFNQLLLTLTVSPAGDVEDALASGMPAGLAFWPQIETEVRQWKFIPFEKDGRAVTSEVEEYIDLVPLERLPKKHVIPPVLRPNSNIQITLGRGGCLGACPAYSVTLGRDGVIFDGRGFVVANGRHTASIAPDQITSLAKRFIAADFYSMDSDYVASVTDCPMYTLSITVNGTTKQVNDYVGAWVGMPAVITELEAAVDDVAGTHRWVVGDNGLVAALQKEKFNFRTSAAQVMLKAAAARSSAATVSELLDAGVPLHPIEPPKPESPDSVQFAEVGWLTSAARDSATLRAMIDASASKNDQTDKDLALVAAAEAGNLESVRALIDYGANPHADLSLLDVTEDGGGMTMTGPGSGTVLTYAARSGNPEVIREILTYEPELEAKDREGQTALFAAGKSGYQDEKDARVKCVELLVQAGANVSARDTNGNTPLHETFLTDVATALLRLGADVNARNYDGETPIFTTFDDAAIPLFIQHGADVTILNNKGQTVVEAAAKRGSRHQEVLRKAIEESAQHKPPST